MARSRGNARQLVVRTERGDGRTVRAAVRDTGVGFPSDALGQAFEPFFTTKAEGMGMGLAITRSILVAHGGQIWLSNNPDRGATVAFELPTFDEQPA
jgi:signal transduction histidine kinase